MRIPSLAELRGRTVSIVSRLRRALAVGGWLTVSDFELESVSDHPLEGELRAGSALVVMDPFPKWVYLRCPCGCGDVVMLSLSESRRPRWALWRDWLGRVSLSPSVHRLEGCRSHFWLHRGTVHWCEQAVSCGLGVDEIPEGRD